jgi:hypothetical protein
VATALDIKNQKGEKMKKHKTSIIEKIQTIFATNRRHRGYYAFDVRPVREKDFRKSFLDW